MKSSSNNLMENPNVWAMVLHLSLLLSPTLIGVVAPIVIWQVKKGSMPEIDAHGRAAVNWMISSFIYALAGFVLTFVVIGIPLLIVLGILGVVFPVIAAVKASDGMVWKYPLSISFFP